MTTSSTSSPEKSPVKERPLVWTRPGATGLRRYLSPYLLSALLMLAGGWLDLESAAAGWTDLTHVFLSQTAYLVALLAILGTLHRKGGHSEEAMTVLVVFGVFLLDALCIQQRYGWDEGPGLAAGFAGAALGLALLYGAAWAVRLPLGSRVVLTTAAAILFLRLGPAVLEGAAPPNAIEPLVPRHVALGWMLVLCAAPALRPALASEGARSTLARVDRIGTGLALVAAVAHFIPAGNGSRSPVHPAYLGPFLVVLPLVLESLWPTAFDRADSRKLCDGLVLVGLCLPALEVTPALLDFDWARRLPLTSFWLTAGLATVVSLARARTRARPELLLVASVTGSLLLLGGDLPEAMVTLTRPEPWHVALVVPITALAAWEAVRTSATPHETARLAFVFSAFPAALVACWLGREGFSWSLAYALVLSWSHLLLGRLGLRASAGIVDPALRWGSLALVSVVPAAYFLGDVDSTVRLAVLAAQLAGLAAGAWVFVDRSWTVAATAGAFLAASGLPVVLQRGAGTSAGRLLTEAAFVLLLVRGERPPRRERPPAVGRADAAALHRAGPRRRAGGPPHGRALLGPRPHRDREDRGADLRAQGDAHDRDRDHNMQQAARVSDETGFFMLGKLVEFGRTDVMFTRPRQKMTEDYITGRFG